MITLAKRQQFGLRNYFETRDRYKTVNKYDELMKECEELFFKDYETILVELTMNHPQIYLNGFVYQDLMRAMETGKREQQAIKQLKNLINQVTWKYNTDLITENTRLTPATAQKYATRLYMIYYGRINKAMKKVLVEIISNL